MTQTKRLSIGGRVAAAVTFLPRITKTLSSLGFNSTFDDRDATRPSKYGHATQEASVTLEELAIAKERWISDLPDAAALLSKAGDIQHALAASVSALSEDSNLLDFVDDLDKCEVLASLDKCYASKDTVNLDLVRFYSLANRKMPCSSFNCSLFLSSNGTENVIFIVLKM